MIKNIFVFMAMLMAIVSCTNKNNVSITGNIKGASKQKVYLEQLNVDKAVIVDSARTGKDGHFTFKTQVELPTFFNVRFGNKEFVTFIAQPEEKIELSGTLEGLSHNYWVEGSENSLWIKLLNFQLNSTQVAMDSLKKIYSTLPADPAFAEKRKEISASWDSVVLKQIDFSKEFILKHAVSPASYYALYQKFDDDNFILDPVKELHSYKIVASSLKAMYPESPYTHAILKHLSQINKDIQNQRIRQLIENTESSLPEIRLPDIKGDTVSLSSIKGKYVVLDFTVLEARDAEGYIREMKAVYEKFRHRKVEIFQVCLDENRLLWENLVKRYGINWICVRDPEGLRSKVAKMWNIQSVPADYIISPESEVVGKNLFGKRLEDRLNDLLK